MGEYHALWQWFATMNSSLLNQNFFFLYILFYAEHLMACPERYGYDFQKKKLILPYTYMWRVYVKLLYKNIRNCGSNETILIEHLTPFFFFPDYLFYEPERPLPKDVCIRFYWNLGLTVLEKLKMRKKYNAKYILFYLLSC